MKKYFVLQMFYLQVIQTKEVKFIPLGIFVFFSIRQTKENHRPWNVNRDKIVSIFNLKKKKRVSLLLEMNKFLK